MKTFYPNNNNLGGKKIIDTHKSKHILSVLNATPQINSLKTPHPHVNGAQSMKKKNIEVTDYFKEVTETYKRVNSLKHGYVNHSEPNTFHLRNSISKKLVFEKNIILHDHMRNITHLEKSLESINKNSEKRIETIKTKAISYKSAHSSQKNLNQHNNSKSIDYQFAGNILDNYNPFIKNPSCYDSADCSLIKKEKVGYFEELSQKKEDEKDHQIKDNNAKNWFEGIILESNGRNYETIKKKIIDCVVKNKIYSKEDAKNLKEQIKIKNENLENGIIDEIFEEIFQHFFK